jgi:hypothetical protein
MSKKKSSPSKNDTIAHRYHAYANNIVKAIPDLSNLKHVTLSLVKSIKVDSGRQVQGRSDVILRKEDEKLIELPSSVPLHSFISKFGIALRSAGKDKFTYDLFAAFFYGEVEADGKMHLDLPQIVYQWSVKDKRLSADVSLGDTWNGVQCVPGFDWNGSRFEVDDFTADPDVFNDNEIVEAGNVVVKFFEGVVENAPTGVHRLEAKSSSSPQPASIVFHKDAEGTVNVEQGSETKLSHMSAMIIRGGNFSSALYSFINEDINDDAGVMRDDSIQEIRAWSVSREEIYALGAKQVIDAYCRDFATGKIIDTPENISYLPAWKIAL